MKYLKKYILVVLLSYLSFTQSVFSSDLKEDQLRDGAEQAAIKELEMHTNTEITENYVQLFDCANYKPVGICIKLFPEFKTRIMMRYYVPFQLTEGNVRPDATTFIKRQKMKQILQKAYQKINSSKSEMLQKEHQNIERQEGETLKFPGESEDEVTKGLDKYHNEEKSFMGVQAEDAATSGYSVGSNHEWHNEMRDQEPFSEEENMFGWCHDYSKHAYSGENDEHPEIDPFHILGVLNPENQKQLDLPLLAYFATKSMDKEVYPDLAERTPEEGDPVLTACYQKKHDNDVGHPKTFGSDDGPELVPEEQQGDEDSDKICPGYGFLGPAGPFWVFGKSYFPAGNAMMGSLRGLVVAFEAMVENPDDIKTVDSDTGRHRLHSYKDEYDYPSDHIQRIWPKPPLEGWKKGCEDTKDQDYYLPPEIRPEDNGEANIWKDENFGQHYRFAHYTSIVCCPEGWIPITSEKLKEG